MAGRAARAARSGRSEKRHVKMVIVEKHVKSAGRARKWQKEALNGGAVSW